MKNKIKFMVFTLLFSLHANAAFSAKESKELALINSQHEAKLIDAEKSFSNSVKEAIDNDPDKKDTILTLKKHWDEFIKAKCDLEVFESKGTDAETAELSNCLVNEYTNAEKYFEHILP